MLLACLACAPALALSELQPAGTQAPASGAPGAGTLVPPGGGVVRKALEEVLPGTAPTPAAQPAAPGAEGPVRPDAAPQGPVAPAAPGSVPESQVMRDTGALPLEVQALRGLILAAAKSGDIEKLRPMLGTGEDAAQLSLTEGVLDDPVAYLRDTGGLPDGTEILAIMIDILESGFVLMDQGTPDEIYVWPYFVDRSIETLTPAERVELLRIVTAGDLEDMQAYGAYTFYRIGITPQGKLAFFLAGD